MVIEDRQEQIDKLYAEHFGHTRASETLASPSSNGSHPTLSDEEIVALASEAKNGAKFQQLWQGDTNTYRSPSEADLALVSMLAFYTQDEAQLDSLFRRSGLMRRKWEDRTDYRQLTITKALEGLTETYTLPSTPTADASSSTGPDQASPSPSLIGVGTQGREGNGTRLKAVRFADMPPPEDRRYLVEGLIPEGYPAVIYGDGGAAKSMLALSLGAAVARGDGEWLGLKVLQAPVLYVDFELDAQEQQRRAYRLAHGTGSGEPPEDLFYLPALGYSASDAFETALEECKEHGINLVVIDSVGLALEGDSEAARDVIHFHNTHIERFRTEDVTVVMVDHQAKQQAGQQYRNKTAFGSVYKGNLARSVIQVEPRRREDGMLTVELQHKKHNFGQLVAPMGAKLTFSEQSVIVEAVELDSGDYEGGKEPTAIDKVRRALEDGPGYPNELAERTKTMGEKPLEVKTVQNKLTELKNQGEVEPTGEKRGLAERVRLVSLSPYTIRDGDRDAAVEDQEASV